MINTKNSLILVLIGYSTNVFAYIDPASGSFIMSLIISALIFIKFFWFKMKVAIYNFLIKKKILKKKNLKK